MKLDDLDEHVEVAIECAERAGVRAKIIYYIVGVCEGGSHVERDTDDIRRITLVGPDGPWCVAAVLAGFRRGENSYEKSFEYDE